MWAVIIIEIATTGKIIFGSNSKKPTSVGTITIPGNRQQFSPFDSVSDLKNQNDINDTIYDYAYLMHELNNVKDKGIYKLTELDPYQRIRSKVRVLSAPIRKQSDVELFGERKEYKLKRLYRKKRKILRTKC